MRAGNAVNNDDYWSFVRSETIGQDAVIDTATGRRVVTYADFTAREGRSASLKTTYWRISSSTATRIPRTT